MPAIAARNTAIVIARRGWRRLGRALSGRRLRCWWRGGHEDRLQWSCDHLWLWCAECGRVTPGWRVGARTHRRPYTQLDPG
jgi:hypothetical protein